jgi:peroxiredoxin
MNEKNDNQPESLGVPKTRGSEETGLAVASLVLGILSILLPSILIRGLCGFAGLGFGIVHLTRKQTARKLASWGVGLSAAGLIVIIIALILYGFKIFQPSAQMEEQIFSEWINKPAPDFTITDIDGKTFTLSQQKGKDVMVVFWATWCPPCKQEIPSLIELRNTYGADMLAIIAISDESDKTLSSFRQVNGLNYTIASAENLPSPYDEVTAIPTTLLIDKNGIIRNATQGYHNFEELKSLLSNLDVTNEPMK